VTTTLKGIAASSGIAIAKAFLLKEEKVIIEKTLISDTSAEVSRFESAISVTKKELETLRAHTEKTLGEDKAAVFSAHLLMLDDPEFMSVIKQKISNESINAEFALQEVSTMFIGMFESMDNEYMKERAADIRDVSKRLLSHLTGIYSASLSDINEEVIVIAEDLTPSDTAQLNPTFVKGFVTDIGGRTSHSAIMARSLGIPCVVGTKTITSSVLQNDIIILDALDGEVVVNPSDSTLATYDEKIKTYLEKKKEQEKLIHEPSVSKDGAHVELVANIGTPQDIEGVIKNGAEGVGLFRTEFLYMNRDTLPTEEEQFQAYKAVLEGVKGKPVVVRTLDVGGDKELPYLNLPKEMNPFLGFRAVRYCLENDQVFRPQLRALLRASIYGDLKIMFPMIATLDEFRQAKATLLDVKEELRKEGHDVSDAIEVGIMVEIPSTAVMADTFAKEVDFFSIGTNDLIQYTMAADRMNEKVSYLYQPYNPAILRLVKMVVDAAHKEGKWAGMCGEMAGDLQAVPLLLGLGLDEFSMSASSVLPVRSLLKTLSKQELAAAIPEILALTSAQEVLEFVENMQKDK